MPSEKLTRILRAKSPFGTDKIAGISDADGWSWVYANASPRKEKLPAVCFSGFTHASKPTLVSSCPNIRQSRTSLWLN